MYLEELGEKIADLALEATGHFTRLSVQLDRLDEQVFFGDDPMRAYAVPEPPNAPVGPPGAHLFPGL